MGALNLFKSNTMKVTIKPSKSKPQPKFPALYRAKFADPKIPSFTVLATGPNEGLIVEADPGAAIPAGRVDTTFIDFTNEKEWQFMGYVESLNITVKA
jgi:hypothetical protein